MHASGSFVVYLLVDTHGGEFTIHHRQELLANPLASSLPVTIETVKAVDWMHFVCLEGQDSHLLNIFVLLKIGGCGGNAWGHVKDLIMM